MIRGLLAFEPRKRMTAAVALHHPWLQYYTQATSNQESPLTNSTIPNNAMCLSFTGFGLFALQS